MFDLQKRKKMTTPKSTTSKKAFKSTESRTFKTGQGWNHTQHGSLGEFKIRILIYRDSYDSQSYARLDVWSTAKMEWSRVHSIPYPEMKSLTVSAYGNNATAANFAADMNDLIKNAITILF